MKLLIIFIILYLNLNLNLINGCSEVSLVYDEKEASGCIGTLPSIIFKNYQQYSVFTITPNPVQLNILAENQTVYLNYEQEYTLSYQSLGCSDTNSKKFTYSQPQTNVPSSISITQPKCLYSQGTLNINNMNSGSSYIVIDENGKQTTMSSSSINLPNGNYLIQDTSSSSTYQSCKIPFTINPPTLTSSPSLNVQPSICYKSNGSLTINNPSIYSNILLNDDNNNEITSTSNGIYTSLESKSYTLSLDSTTCGKQVLPIEIGLSSPRLSFSITDASCPSKPKIQVSIDDSSLSNTEQYSMTLNGVLSSTDNTISPTIPPNTYDLPFTFEYKQCNLEFQLPISKVLMDLTFDFVGITSQDLLESSLLNNCNASTSINIQYDSSEIQGLEIKNTKDSSTVTPNQDGAYPITMNTRLSLTSTCYTDPTYIEIPQPEPIFNVENGIDTESCMENTTIRVYNYLDFQSISLQFVSDPSKTISLSSDGYFKNIFRTNYNLIYQYCSTSPIASKVINLSNEDIIPEFYILPNSNNQNIDCQSKLGSLSIVLKKSDGTNSTSLPIKYDPTNLSNTIIKINDYCSIKLNLNSKLSDSFNYYLSTKPTLKITQPTCLYSNDGSIEITSNLNLQTIIIGDKQFRKQSNNIYGGLTNGTYNVKVIFDNNNSNYCGGLIYDLGMVDLVSKDTKFKIETTIHSVTDCSNNDGSITILGYSSFSSLKIDSTSASNGVFSGLSSNIYNLDFASSNCSGTLPIYISTNNQNTLLSNTILTPTCYSDPLLSSNTGIDGDGIVSFTLLDINNNQLTINSITELNSNTIASSNTISSSPGSKDFLIVSGSCSYRKSIKLIQSDSKIVYTPTSPYNCVNNVESGLVGTTQSGININQITLLSSTNSPKVLLGNSITSLPSGQYGAIVQWNNVCQKTIPFITSPTATLPEPILQFTQDSCMTNYNLKLTVSNYNLFNSLSINGQQSTDNGVFYKLPITRGTLNYIDKTSMCSNSIDFNYDSFNSNIDSSIKTLYETCHGSCNGYLNYTTTSTSTNYQSNIIIKENSKSILLPNKLISTNNYQNYGISTTKVFLNSIKKVNPYCTIITPISFLSSEPEFVNVADQICSPYFYEKGAHTEVTSEEQSSSSESSNNSPKTISIEESILLINDNTGQHVNLPTSFGSIKYSLVNVKSPLININSSAINSAQYHSLEYGEYILKASISNKICKRQIVETLLLNSNTSNKPYLVMVDSENYCQRVALTPSNINATYNYIISNQTSVILNYTHVVGSLVSDTLSNSQDYTIQVEQLSSDNKSIINQCQISFTLKKCPSENSSKVKLILGIVLAVVVATFIIVYCIYKLRQRSLRKNDDQEKQHELDDQEYQDDNESIQQHHFIGE